MSVTQFRIFQQATTSLKQATTSLNMRGIIDINWLSRLLLTVSTDVFLTFKPSSVGTPRAFREIRVFTSCFPPNRFGFARRLPVS